MRRVGWRCDTIRMPDENDLAIRGGAPLATSASAHGLSRRNTSRARRALRKGVAMITISIKRVYETPSSRDGVRILVDRLWPRGMSKDAAALDLWCKELAPTPALRTWFDHRSDRFAEFKG